MSKKIWFNLFALIFLSVIYVCIEFRRKKMKLPFYGYYTLANGKKISICLPQSSLHYDRAWQKLFCLFHTFRQQNLFAVGKFLRRTFSSGWISAMNWSAFELFRRTTMFRWIWITDKPMISISIPSGSSLSIDHFTSNNNPSKLDTLNIFCLFIFLTRTTRISLYLRNLFIYHIFSIHLFQ